MTFAEYQSHSRHHQCLIYVSIWTWTLAEHVPVHLLLINWPQ